MKKLFGVILILIGIVIVAKIFLHSGPAEWFSSFHNSQPQAESVSVAGAQLVKIDGDSANVHVIPENRQNVMAELQGGGHLTVSRSGDTVKVHVHNSWLNWIPFGKKRTVLDVHVPEDYNRSMAFDLQWGNVQFYGKSADHPMVLNKLRFDMNAGNVQLRNLKLQALNQNGSAGNVDLRQVAAGEASFDMSAGNLELSQFKGQLSADISAGRLDAQFDQLTGPIQVHISAGRARVNLPDQAGFQLDAKVSHGDVSCDLPLKNTILDGHDHIKGTHGSGQYKVNLHVSNGDIQVN